MLWICVPARFISLPHTEHVEMDYLFYGHSQLGLTIGFKSSLKWFMNILWLLNVRNFYQTCLATCLDFFEAGVWLGWWIRVVLLSPEGFERHQLLNSDYIWEFEGHFRILKEQRHNSNCKAAIRKGCSVAICC